MVYNCCVSIVCLCRIACYVYVHAYHLKCKVRCIRNFHGYYWSGELLWVINLTVYTSATVSYITQHHTHTSNKLFKCSIFASMCFSFICKSVFVWGFNVFGVFLLLVLTLTMALNRILVDCRRLFTFFGIKCLFFFLVFLLCRLN